MAAFLYFAAEREKRELAQRLALDALAARGDPKALKKQHAELVK